MEKQGIWSFILGRVQFSVRGGDTARFLNLCAGQGLALSHLRADPFGLTGWLPARQYKKLRLPARRCRCRVRLCRRVGISFSAAKLARRKGVLAGLLAFFLLWQWACSVIWTVSYYNMSPQNAALLAPYLVRYGLVRGARPTDEQMERARQGILLEEPYFSALSFQFVRGRLLVETTLARPKPDIRDNTTPMDIVAAKDGILQRVQVASGYAVRSAGQSVAKGEVIVSHSYTDPKTGITTTGQAHAVVTAQTETAFYFFQPFHFTQTAPTGKTACRYSIGTGSRMLALYWDKNPPFEEADCEKTVLPVSLLGFALPFYIQKESFVQLEEQVFTLTEEEAKLRALTACRLEVKNAMKTADIQSRSVTFNREEEGVSCRVQVTAIEQIGVQAEPTLPQGQVQGEKDV